MLREFQEKLMEIPGVDPSRDRFLLAVSGGLDSVVLAHLFKQANYFFGIAHCNFKLRAEASDRDEIFVQRLASGYLVPFWSKSFPTRDVAEKKKMSIQETARELRYRWLEKMREKEDFHWIVTAHHLNDNLETVIYNFTKGTGLRGLQGIPPRNERIIRPLLPFSRAEIEHYLKQADLQFREDQSNREVKYARNRIRHQVLPILKKINPGLLDTFRSNRQHWQDATVFMEERIEQLRRQCETKNGQETTIRLGPILNHPAAQTLLFEILRPAHFNGDQCAQMLVAARNQQVGAQFYSPTHQLLLDRDVLIYKKNRPHFYLEILLAQDIPEVQLGHHTLEVSRHAGQPRRLPPDAWSACLDARNLSFPMKIRRWRAGDVFCPLGMSGHHKKLQDLFTDHKLSRFEKEDIWILENGNGDICWVIGFHLDERYKIDEKTKSYYYFCLRS